MQILSSTTATDSSGTLRKLARLSNTDGDPGDTVHVGATTPASLADGDVWMDPTPSAEPPGPSVPIGSMLRYAGSSAPENYLLCNGAAISRTTYAALFAVTDTTHGAGNGTTTFNIPDTSPDTYIIRAL